MTDNTTRICVPFMDLRITDKRQRKNLLCAIKKVFDHGRFILGPEVQQLEKQVANFCNRRYAIGVNSGTDALYLALRSLDIGEGDEVITTSLSWVATANAIALTGAKPVFADIRDDLNIDPASVERLITKKTKAIMPVHFTGKICQMDQLLNIAREYDLLLVEDACQSFGASFKNRLAGTFGDIACFSMNPMKVFAGCGEAGMVVTNRKDLHKRLTALRYNGMIDRNTFSEVSLNGRIDTLQAAILLKRLDYVETVIEKRREIASWYNDLLKGIVGTPEEEQGQRHSYYLYTIRSSSRDALKDFLHDKGIETQIHHPYLLCDLPAFKTAKSNTANASLLIKQILCIPANEKLLREDIEYIAACIKEFCNA